MGCLLVPRTTAHEYYDDGGGPTRKVDYDDGGGPTPKVDNSKNRSVPDILDRRYKKVDGRYQIPRKLDKDKWGGEDEGLVFHGQNVKYLRDKAERAKYELTIKDGNVYDADGKLFDTNKITDTYPDGRKKKAIYVMDMDGKIYASMKPEVGEFHHSSFLAGGDVACAGTLKAPGGKLKGADLSSGHYWPTKTHTEQLKNELFDRGVDITKIDFGGYP